MQLVAAKDSAPPSAEGRERVLRDPDGAAPDHHLVADDLRRIRCHQHAIDTQANVAQRLNTRRGVTLRINPDRFYRRRAAHLRLRLRLRAQQWRSRDQGEHRHRRQQHPCTRHGASSPL